ncbi:hypothetical protein [Methanococcus maripaludis]|uniref:Putative Zn ribbon protein n=1 Tax=Methanococcus maripaludis TaxID=39152 RepID=A0A8T4CKK7_METMI|nr:hypothetical protein [Methanococcus maripaludis]MBM7408897.1 putative Zn ribbon protein [Methanococcus maripaludis]MBP2218916.1 putative Zn ribbon protein [Methanococcus maripaludis]
MKRFLILAIVALSMLVSVSADIYIPEANMTINESGTYVLSEDILTLNETGIWINASNVILDGNNHIVTGNSTSKNTGISVYNANDKIENVTIKNLKIKNWSTGVKIGWNVKNITITNCEFEDNEYFLNSYASEQYFYLNTIHKNQSAESYTPLASPKLVYTYGGNEYTYRLGNYYEGYTGTEIESEGVYKGDLELFGWEGGAYDPYPLINTPENYKIIKTLYPEVELKYEEDGALIADIFALTSDPENYVITDAPVTTTTTTPRSGSGGRSYDSDISDDIQSRIIKNFVSSATVIYGNEIDENYANQLRERIQNANGFTITGNAVIVGGPFANPFAMEYNEQFEMPITNENPGENKGIIQVLKVQDTSGSIIKSYTIVYIAGSDRLGTLAAMEYFKTLEDLPTGPITVEWTENGPVLA